MGEIRDKLLDDYYFGLRKNPTFACDGCDASCNPKTDPECLQEIGPWKITTCPECRSRLNEQAAERAARRPQEI